MLSPVVKRVHRLFGRYAEIRAATVRSYTHEPDKPFLADNTVVLVDERQYLHDVTKLLQTIKTTLEENPVRKMALERDEIISYVKSLEQVADLKLENVEDELKEAESIFVEHSAVVLEQARRIHEQRQSRDDERLDYYLAICTAMEALRIVSSVDEKTKA